MTKILVLVLLANVASGAIVRVDFATSVETNDVGSQFETGEPFSGWFEYSTTATPLSVTPFQPFPVESELIILGRKFEASHFQTSAISGDEEIGNPWEVVLEATDLISDLEATSFTSLSIRLFSDMQFFEDPNKLTVTLDPWREVNGELEMRFAYEGPDEVGDFEQWAVSSTSFSLFSMRIIPEPSTALFFQVALVALFIRRR